MQKAMVKTIAFFISAEKWVVYERQRRTAHERGAACHHTSDLRR